MRHKTLIDQLIYHEGERLKPYRCTAGKLTIGVGRNIEDVGITREESRFLLVNDIEKCVTDLLTIFPDFYLYDQARQWALIDLRFNLGPGGFRSFRRMIAAIKRGDWQQAAAEAIDSKWSKQVQYDRVTTITRQMRTGQ